MSPTSHTSRSSRTSATNDNSNKTSPRSSCLREPLNYRGGALPHQPIVANDNRPRRGNHRKEEECRSENASSQQTRSSIPPLLAATIGADDATLLTTITDECLPNRKRSKSVFDRLYRDAQERLLKEARRRSSQIAAGKKTESHPLWITTPDLAARFHGEATTSFSAYNNEQDLNLSSTTAIHSTSHHLTSHDRDSDDDDAMDSSSSPKDDIYSKFDSALHYYQSHFSNKKQDMIRNDLIVSSSDDDDDDDDLQNKKAVEGPKEDNFSGAENRRHTEARYHTDENETDEELLNADSHHESLFLPVVSQMDANEGDVSGTKMTDGRSSSEAITIEKESDETNTFADSESLVALLFYSEEQQEAIKHEGSKNRSKDDGKLVPSECIKKEIASDVLEGGSLVVDLTLHGTKGSKEGEEERASLPFLHSPSRKFEQEPERESIGVPSTNVVPEKGSSTDIRQLGTGEPRHPKEVVASSWDELETPDQGEVVVISRDCETREEIENNNGLSLKHSESENYEFSKSRAHHDDDDDEPAGGLIEGGLYYDEPLHMLDHAINNHCDCAARKHDAPVPDQDSMSGAVADSFSSSSLRYYNVYCSTDEERIDTTIRHTAGLEDESTYDAGDESTVSSIDLRRETISLANQVMMERLEQVRAYSVLFAFVILSKTLSMNEIVDSTPWFVVKLMGVTNLCFFSAVPVLKGPTAVMEEQNRSSGDCLYTRRTVVRRLVASRKAALLIVYIVAWLYLCDTARNLGHLTIDVMRHAFDFKTSALGAIFKTNDVVNFSEWNNISVLSELDSAADRHEITPSVSEASKLVQLETTVQLSDDNEQRTYASLVDSSWNKKCHAPLQWKGYNNRSLARVDASSNMSTVPEVRVVRNKRPSSSRTCQLPLFTEQGSVRSFATLATLRNNKCIHYDWSPKRTNDEKDNLRVSLTMELVTTQYHRPSSTPKVDASSSCANCSRLFQFVRSVATTIRRYWFRLLLALRRGMRRVVSMPCVGKNPK